MKRPGTLLVRTLLWAAFFVFSRLLFLYYFVDSAWTPEEAYRGTVALEFHHALHGISLKLPFWCYQADQYLGGSLVTALVTALNFSVFGLSLFSLKLTALYFALAALVVTYRWLHEEYGPGAADAFALLYGFAAPGFAALGLVSMGYHTESVVFLALTLAQLRRIEQSPGAGRALFLLGCVGGLGFWFSNINALVFVSALCALPPALRRKGRSFLWLGGGFAAGAAVWILYNATNGFPGLAYLLSSFNGSSFSPVGRPLRFAAGKIFLLLARDLPLAFGFGPGAAGYLYAALAVLAVAAGARRLHAPFRRLLLAYSGLFCLAYGFSNYYLGTRTVDPVHYRYFHQLIFLLYVGAAIVISQARWRAGALAAAVLFSLFGLGSLARTGPPGRVFEYRAYSYPDLSAKVMGSCYAGSAQLPALLGWIASYPEKERALLNIPFIGAYDFRPLVEEGKAGFPVENPYFAEGLGNFCGGSVADTHRLLGLAAGFPGSAGKKFWSGVTRGTGASVIVEQELQEHFESQWRDFFLSFEKNIRLCFDGRPLPAKPEEWAAKGQGAALADCGILESRMGTLAEEVSREQSDAFRKDIAWGIGWRLRLRYLPDPLRVFDRIRLLPRWAWEGALTGAADFETSYALPESESVKQYSGDPAYL